MTSEEILTSLSRGKILIKGKGNLKSLYVLDSTNNILYIMTYHYNIPNTILQTFHIDLKVVGLDVVLVSDDYNTFRECGYNLYEIYKHGMECE